MRLRTKVFDIGKEKHVNLTELARAMGISLSQIYRVRQAKRNINEKFIVGALSAFPGYRLDELCSPAQGRRRNDGKYQE